MHHLINIVVKIQLRNVIHTWKDRVQVISRRSDEPHLESTLDLSTVSTALHNSPGERELMLNHVDDSINFQDLIVQQRIAHRYLRHALQAWSFIQHKAQIRRYREISMEVRSFSVWKKKLYQTYFRRRMRYKHSMFWLRNMQDELSVITRRCYREMYDLVRCCYLPHYFFKM